MSKPNFYFPFQTIDGLLQFMHEKLHGDKDKQVWKPRLTRDTIKFAAKDPEASP